MSVSVLIIPSCRSSSSRYHVLWHSERFGHRPPLIWPGRGAYRKREPVSIFLLWSANSIRSFNVLRIIVESRSSFDKHCEVHCEARRRLLSNPWSIVRHVRGICTASRKIRSECVVNLKIDATVSFALHLGFYTWRDCFKLCSMTS